MTPYYDEGGITIYHGDCRDVLPHIQADAIVTDPPYGVAYDLGNDTDATGGRPLIEGALDMCPSATLLAFGPARSRYELATWDWRWTLVWHKPMIRAHPAWGIARHYEFLYWYERAGGLRPTETLSDVLVANPPIFRTNPETVAHPAQKPVILLRKVIAAFNAQTILDPFMGSGTTLRAAQDLGRRAIGIEIEERYCEIAAKRLSQQTLGLDVPA